MNYYHKIIQRRLDTIGRVTRDLKDSSIISNETFREYSRDLIKHSQDELASIAMHTGLMHRPVNVEVILKTFSTSITVSHNKDMPHFGEVFNPWCKTPIDTANEICKVIHDLNQSFIATHLIVHYDLSLEFHQTVVKLLMEKDCMPNELFGSNKRDAFKCDCLSDEGAESSSD